MEKYVLIYKILGDHNVMSILKKHQNNSLNNSQYTRSNTYAEVSSIQGYLVSVTTLIYLSILLKLV